MLRPGQLNCSVFSKRAGRSNQDGGAATQLRGSAGTTATPYGDEWENP